MNRRSPRAPSSGCDLSTNTHHTLTRSGGGGEREGGGDCGEDGDERATGAVKPAPATRSGSRWTVGTRCSHAKPPQSPVEAVNENHEPLTHSCYLCRSSVREVEGGGTGREGRGVVGEGSSGEGGEGAVKGLIRSDLNTNPAARRAASSLAPASPGRGTAVASPNHQQNLVFLSPVAGAEISSHKTHSATASFGNPSSVTRWPPPLVRRRQGVAASPGHHKPHAG
ncbi:hypothetical protein E2C01_024216 [Portunus trituberculatus]|uniref:Uncharacterized protein n=1 Tax=Portunus trituberculatus TaxID=210409 RepID=A0A5B7EDZ5_PORTR|nr:hypothetical protein [Portunus trituberculatus]